MSLIINGMEMPKQTEVQTDKGTLKLWTIRNHKVGQDIQFGAAAIPCDLNFNHDGTIHLSLLGKKYTLTGIPSPHGDLIDRDDLLYEINRSTFVERYDYNTAYDAAALAETIIEAEDNE